MIQAAWCETRMWQKYSKCQPDHGNNRHRFPWPDRNLQLERREKTALRLSLNPDLVSSWNGRPLCHNYPKVQSCLLLTWKSHLRSLLNQRKLNKISQIKKSIREEGHGYQLSLYKYTIFKFISYLFYTPPPIFLFSFLFFFFFFLSFLTWSLVSGCCKMLI